MKGNKGEWSEIYVFLKLLADGKLPIGGHDLKPFQDLVYPVLSVIREEIKNQPIKYDRDEVFVTIVNDSERTNISIPISLFTEKSKELFELIREMSSVKQFPSIEPFLRQIKCTKVKASSSQKTDIEVIIYDAKLALSPKLGFSIKSQLGSPATLLNASQATNVEYTLSPIVDASFESEVNMIEGKSKIQRRLSLLSEKDINIVYSQIPNATFRNNLMLVDTAMPEIISWLLLYYYQGKGAKLSTLVKELENQNPLAFDSTGPSFYEYKIKKLLVEIALGMTPTKQWSGQYDATGGYIIVRESGDLLCYHVYNRNLFEDYLFNNTQLDTPSSSRHKFGEISNGKTVRLNLQIRFCR
ncbi:HpaII family restriction endonuclease [Porphyromonas somerae]|uniref:HpaII family restriction endonuclease n=1 Tax=Porphyromonas somerae TaxID=322095 RepID=UPI002A76127A|nr:HpaII family restriction endonuclease [Porphyromonas somerae]MDY3120623.1 HpaII family restriction endonuclease [Porphyromonas somerae]